MPLPTAIPGSPFADELLYARGICPELSLSELDRALAWRQDAIQIYGRRVPLPRLTAWYGEPQAVYRYSGIINEPLPWTPELQALRSLVQSICGVPFNSVLANRYADGLQHQGYHADDEKELGEDPWIASLSFGATRRFLIKERKGTGRWRLDLESGSLLVMRGAFQARYLHALAKTKKLAGLRINLTFRQIKHY